VTIQSFSEVHPKLCEEFGKAFATWVLDVQDAIDGKNSSIEVKPTTSFISIEKGDGGIPILPQPIKGKAGYELLETKRTIIRMFFNDHYRETLHPSQIDSLLILNYQDLPPATLMHIHPGTQLGTTQRNSLTSLTSLMVLSFRIPVV